MAIDRRLEQARRGGEEDRQGLVVLADFAREIVIAFAGGRIDRHVSQTVEEIGHPATAMIGQVFLERLSREIAKLARGHFRTSGAYDLQVGFEQAFGIERAQRRQEHALREIARGAEQQQPVCSNIHSRSQAIIRVLLTQR